MFARSPKIAVAACLMGFAACAVTACAAQDEYSFRTTVTEIRLTLIATDQQHQYVNNLSSSELAVVDNEIVVRKFRSFIHSPEVPLNVLLLVDASDSVNDSRKREAAATLESIRKAEWGTSDSVSVLTFGSGAPLLTCVKNCPALPREAAAPLAVRTSLSPLYDTMLVGTKLLAQTRNPEAKSIMIVFSDGADNYSLHSVNETVAALELQDVTVYGVDLNCRRSNAPGSYALQQMASATGGLRLAIDDGADRVLGTVLSDLRSGYVLTYVPPNPAQGLHAVQVLPTRNLNLKFRSRQGYLFHRVSETARVSR